MIFEDTPVVSQMTDLLRQACIEAGYGATQDHNGAKFDGFDLWETIFPYGRRRNSAEAYLRPARVRKNLTILTRAMTTQIEIAGTGADFVAFIIEFAVLALIAQDGPSAINRLIVRCAEDTVFYRDNSAWVQRFIAKNRHYRVESSTSKQPAGNGSLLTSRLKIVSVTGST